MSYALASLLALKKRLIGDFELWKIYVLTLL